MITAQNPYSHSDSGMILPAFGVTSEIIPTFSRKPLFGYQAMVYAIASIAFLSFIVWAHHMQEVRRLAAGAQPEIFLNFGATADAAKANTNLPLVIMICRYPPTVSCRRAGRRLLRASAVDVASLSLTIE